MGELTKEQWLELIQKLADAQYDDLTIDYEDLYYEPPKPRLFMNDGITDLTGVKNNELKSLIKLNNNKNFKIDKFLIKICYSFNDVKCYKVNFCIFEDIKLDSKKLTCKVKIKNDSRFVGRNWASYFDKFNMAKNMPEDIFIEVLKYVQIVSKLELFI
jgi:hypothetical protein